MLAKILLRSFSKQLRTYAVYSLSILISVTIFYSFGAMTYDQPILRSVRQDLQISGIMTFGNVIVALVVFVFMMTANYFFVQQRKPDMALFQLFGMRRREIISIFVLENILVNLISLGMGIITGLFTSKLFSMILIKAMNLNIESSFFISWVSVKRTIIIFMLFLIPLSFQNMWLIRDKQLIVSTHLSTNQKIVRQSVRWYHHVLGFIGAVFMISGYFLSFHLLDILDRLIKLTHNYTSIVWFPLFIFFLVVIGTLLFFSFTLTGILTLISQRKKWNDYSLNAFVFSNARSQIQQSWRALSFITVTIGLSIVFLGISAGYLTVSYRLNLMENPTSFQLAPNKVETVKKLIADAHGKIKEEETVHFKLTGMYVQKKNKLMDSQYYGQTELVNLVSESNYQQVRPLLPNAPMISLKNENQTVFFNQDFLITSRLSTYNKTLCLENKQLTIVKSYSDFFGDSFLRYTKNLIIVKDEVFQRLPGVPYQVIYMNTTGYNLTDFQQKMDVEAPVDWQEDVYYHIKFSNGQLISRVQTEDFPEAKNTLTTETYSGSSSRLSHTNQFPSLRLSRRKSGLFLFVAIFVGTIILISTVSTLIVRQFSRLEDEKKVYGLLKNIGVDTRSIRRAILMQNSWLFFPVMLLSISHGTVAVYILTRMIPSSNYWMVYLFALVVFVMFVLFYFLSTLISIRIIEEEKKNR